MTSSRSDGSDTLLGAWLLGLAGFVDAIAFVVLHGSFVAFMSGNSTIFGASGAVGHWRTASLSVLLIVLFFLGNVLGALQSRFLGRTAHRSLMISIAVVTTVGTVVATWMSEAAGMITIAIAAGLINSALSARTDVHVGLTYVTGTLVKSAHQLVDGLGSDHPWAWIKTLGFWAIFACGAAIGGVAYHGLGSAALWFAVALAVIACLLPHRFR